MEGNSAGDPGGLPPAGWYPNPDGGETERYWDGAQWSDHSRPAAAVPPPPPAATTPAPTTPMPLGQAQPQPQSPPTASPFSPNPFEPSGPVPPAPGPAPGYQTPPMAPPPRSGGGSGSKVLMAFGVLFLLLLGGCAVIGIGSVFVLRSAGDELITELEQIEQGDFESFPATTIVGEPEPAPDAESGLVEESVVSGDGRGSRSDPLSYDESAVLNWDVFGDADGSVWETTVGAPRDMTAEILANDFNRPAPDGVTFLGFPVSMTLLEAEKEPLSAGANFSWEILGGATAAAYDTNTLQTETVGCGLIENDFGIFDEVFVGGTIEGTVCIPVPTEDVDHPDTQVAMHFAGDTRAVFGP